MHSDVASAAGPPMFRIVSAMFPQCFRSLSVLFPHHLRCVTALKLSPRTVPAVFPQSFRIVSAVLGSFLQVLAIDLDNRAGVPTLLAMVSRDYMSAQLSQRVDGERGIVIVTGAAT